MRDLFDLGDRLYTDPRELPPAQRILHRRQMRAIRAERERARALESEEQRRWPGLVDEQTTTHERSRT